ncbi:MAG: LysE family transporter [Dehalococcoidia bacterium]|nr:LysE family transporter [Dehalococcoidia bacterium]
MLPIILSVLVISLSGVMMPGPMFAMTVAKSYRSPWAGAKVAIGHAIIEVPLILVIYFGFARFFSNTTFQLVLSLLGGGMLIWMGIGMFRARSEVVDSGKDLRYGAVTAGIVMSAINPFFLLWWATVGLLLVKKFADFGTIGIPIFIFTHWVCDLVWLSIVSFVIYRTRTLWGRAFQTGVFIVCSLLLLGFGGWFIVSGIQQML